MRDTRRFTAKIVLGELISFLWTSLCIHFYWIVKVISFCQVMNSPSFVQVMVHEVAQTLLNDLSGVGLHIEWDLDQLFLLLFSDRNCSKIKEFLRMVVDRNYLLSKGYFLTDILQICWFYKSFSVICLYDLAHNVIEEMKSLQHFDFSVACIIFFYSLALCGTRFSSFCTIVLMFSTATSMR